MNISWTILPSVSALRANNTRVIVVENDKNLHTILPGLGKLPCVILRGLNSVVFLGFFYFTGNLPGSSQDTQHHFIHKPRIQTLAWTAGPVKQQHPKKQVRTHAWKSSQTQCRSWNPEQTQQSKLTILQLWFPNRRDSLSESEELLHSYAEHANALLQDRQCNQYEPAIDQ